VLATPISERRQDDDGWEIHTCAGTALLMYVRVETANAVADDVSIAEAL
jgi:hypothetical protein